MVNIMAEVSAGSFIPPNAVTPPAQPLPPPGLDSTVRVERAAKRSKENEEQRDEQSRARVDARRAQTDASRERRKADQADTEARSDQRRGNKLDIRA